jgi:hypothetical protein
MKLSLIWAVPRRVRRTILAGKRGRLTHGWLAMGYRMAPASRAKSMATIRKCYDEAYFNAYAGISPAPIHFTLPLYLICYVSAELEDG